MELTTPHYPDDHRFVASMTPAVREKFEVWMKDLDAAHVKAGSPYGKRSLWAETGAACWAAYFEEGTDPADALAEYLDHAEECP